MQTVINLGIIILVFGVIIAFHELGHFLMCRLVGIGVTEFSVGMGPAIFKTQKNETQYSLRLLPIGGYCLMMGAENFDDDTPDYDDRSYANHNIWHRMLVTLGGPLFNFLLAFIISVVLIAMAGYLNCTVNYVLPGSAAEAAGLQEGDNILRMNDTKIHDFREVSLFMEFYKSEDPIRVQYERDGVVDTVEVTPNYVEDIGRYRMGLLGGYVESTEDPDYVVRPKGNAFTVIKYSVLEMRYQLASTILSLKYLVTGRMGVKNVSSVVGVADTMNESMKTAKAEGGLYTVFLNVLNFLILLSANLGVMNLLPVPALDGGNLLFLLFELVTRKPVPKNREAVVKLVGFAILFIIMILVVFKDVFNIVQKFAAK